MSDLDARIRAVRKVENDQIPFEFNPQTQQVTLGPTVYVRADPKLSVLSGEILYNLRAALDYLIFELAALDSGMEQKGTQFPIEKTPEGFAGRTPTYLKRLTVEHRAAIEALQPYKGCRWTHTLRALSNPDRHRKLLATPHLAEASLTISKDIPGAFDHIASGKTYRTTSADGVESDVHVEADISIQIRFTNGAPVMETLKQLLAEVRNVLDAFNPEFQRKAP